MHQRDIFLLKAGIKESSIERVQLTEAQGCSYPLGHYVTA